MPLRVLFLCFLSALAASAANAQVNYATQIQPILTSQCAGCHGSGSLDFRTYASVMASTSSAYGRAIVQSGNPNFSPLYDKLLPNPQFGSRMPLGGSLTANQIELIRNWISEGATSLDGADIPDRTVLLQNYPNPFNPSTVIGWRLAVGGRTRITVHDITGREVARLVDAVYPAGPHQVTFDASGLPSGVYLYRLNTDMGGITRKMVLMR
jgi:mono/diheme cytochrome c family protein